MDPFTHDRLAVTIQNLIVLRKTALLAHWVPELAVELAQPGRPTLRVTTCASAGDGGGLAFHPCEFRRIVLQLIAQDAVGMCGLIDLEHARLAPRSIAGPAGSDARGRATLGPHGLVRFRVDDDQGAFALATTLAVPVPGGDDRGRRDDGRAHPARTPSPTRPTTIAVGFDRDEELGATLVHATFPVGDTRAEHEAFEQMYDLAIVLGADELATLLDTVV